jgi:hypothetical protein
VLTTQTVAASAGVPAESTGHQRFKGIAAEMEVVALVPA